MAGARIPGPLGTSGATPEIDAGTLARVTTTPPGPNDKKTLSHSSNRAHARDTALILSFDDGPGPVDALASILRTLEKDLITAEFYVLGNEVERYPKAAQMIVEKGHKIQSHSV